MGIVRVGEIMIKEAIARGEVVIGEAFFPPYILCVGQRSRPVFDTPPIASAAAAAAT